MPKKTFFNLSSEKRRRVEESALHEFEQYIYGDASINRIVKNAGIAKGSFYQYFEDKMDLALYVLSIIGDEETAYIESNLSMIPLQDNDFFLCIRKQIEMSVEFGLKNRQYITVYRNLMLSNELILQQRIAEMTNVMGIEYYREKIEWHMAQGNIRQDISSVYMAQYLMMLIFSLLDEFFKSDLSDIDTKRKNMSSMVDALLEIIKSGIKKQGDNDVRDNC